MRLIWKAPEQTAVLVADYVFIPHFVASLFRLFFFYPFGRTVTHRIIKTIWVFLNDS